MSRHVEERATADVRATEEVTSDQAMELLERMTRIRHFELRVNQLYLSAKMPGLAHLYAGEEAVAVGVCSVLRRDDVITSTHRGHGHCLAKGASVDLMFAELLGKEAGYCHGQGVLYEVMNMASLWKLPVIYVCENNLYNEYTHYRETTAGNVTARAESFGIPAAIVDGQDVLAVRGAASRAVERARVGEGPTFLECRTYRFFGHHVGDVDRSYYRSKQEEEEWRSARDPLKLFGIWIRERGHATEDDLKALDERVAAEVEEGERFALDASYPDVSEVDRHVYP